MRITKNNLTILILALTVLSAIYQSASAAPPRKFYLTKSDTFNGAHALNACAKGYHMASLFEILDVSNLVYDTTLGHTTADSGFGPPAISSLSTSEQGWVRTGGQMQTANFLGLANCSAWDSDFSQDYGTVSYMGLPGALVSATWAIDTAQCNLERRVWCIQD
jgi:hypothetical protein